MVSISATSHPGSLSFRRFDRAKRGTESKGGSELNFRAETMEIYFGTHVEREYQKQFSPAISVAEEIEGRKGVEENEQRQYCVCSVLDLLPYLS